MDNRSLPTGIVTFLFTDIQGSTLLWESRPDLMAQALQTHNSIIRQAIQSNAGVVFKVIGDAFQAAFESASQALKAAIEAQRGLYSAPWNELGPLKVRMGLHSGEAELDPQGDEYTVSHTKNRTSRIMSAGHGGQILISSVMAELLEGQLPGDARLKDMGEHQLRGLLHPEHLFQVVLPGLPEEFPSLVTEDPHSNLPLPATSFLNRESELARIKKLLTNGDSRLITLTGIGGSGKTRLAIEAARAGQLIFRNVYFVGLAGISSLDELLLKIAEVIDYSFRAPSGVALPVEEARAQLLRYLADKKVLLVLDNFEQLACCADVLADLLSAGEEVRLLVTSRERLNLPGEWVQEISGLSFPEQNEQASIAEFAAVQLFVKSAERASHFTPAENDWPAIARICQLLDGMPLGVEMAAAWVKLMSCQEILAEIERDFDFLAATWRNVPERHQTLWSVFETSWRLLTPEERASFCRLAILHGGFQHEAAKTIAGASLSTLAALVDKSLVRRVASGRFEIHPVLKPYAIEKLSSDPAAQAEARLRHARYFSDLLSGQMFVKLKGGEQIAALGVLRAEMQNLRLACQELIAQRDFKRLEGVVPALILFYEINNQRVETQEGVIMLEDMEKDLRQALANPTDEKHSGLMQEFYQALLALTLAALHHFKLIFHGPQAEYREQIESLQLLQDLPDTTTKAYAILLSCRGPGSLSIDERLDLCQQCFGIFKRIHTMPGGQPWHS